MMNLNRKKLTTYLLLGVGIVLVIASFVIDESYLLGLGAGVIGGGIAQLIKYKRVLGTEEKRDAFQIEMEDPRNTEIRTKARAKAGFYLDLALILLVLILPFTSAPFWLTVVLIVLFLAYEVMTYIFIKQLNNEI